jgi:uncharacterized protein
MIQSKRHRESVHGNRFGGEDGRLAYVRPTSEAGQHVCLRAEMDLIMFSACPQDMIPVNDMKSADAHFTIA